jgi:2-desacetyl-2-hydroxyethyl bacteriochlorophyllide A dehydrogenase
VTVARTVWFERPGVAALRREPLREPGPGEVRVRAICSGVSAGTERLVLLGRVPVAARAMMALPAMKGGFELPVAYGYATVGVVEAVGPGYGAEPAPGASGDRLGERVFALHPHQDVLVVPVGALRPLPDGPPAERLVLAANLETAINVVWDAEIGLGDRVVVTGLGVVGLLVAWLARRAGASVVIGVDRDPARGALSVALGADSAETSTEAAGVDAADVLIEASGSPALLADLLASAGPEARVVVASWYGDAPVGLPLGGRFHPHRVTLRSSQVGALDPRRRARWTLERRWALAGDLLTDAALDRLIAPSVLLSAAPALYDELARGVVWHPPQRVIDAQG